MTCDCGTCQAIRKTIQGCKDELQKIENGTNERPQIDDQEGLTIWYGLIEERHEYLEGLQSTLEFLLNSPNKMKYQV